MSRGPRLRQTHNYLWSEEDALGRGAAGQVYVAYCKSANSVSSQCYYCSSYKRQPSRGGNSMDTGCTVNTRDNCSWTSYGWRGLLQCVWSGSYEEILGCGGNKLCLFYSVNLGANSFRLASLVRLSCYNVYEPLHSSIEMFSFLSTLRNWWCIAFNGLMLHTCAHV